MIDPSSTATAMPTLTKVAVPELDELPRLLGAAEDLEATEVSVTRLGSGLRVSGMVDPSDETQGLAVSVAEDSPCRTAGYGGIDRARRVDVEKE
jgi:hypothetical protein